MEFRCLRRQHLSLSFLYRLLPSYKLVIRRSNPQSLASKMYSFVALSLLATSQLITALPQSSSKSINQGPVLEAPLTTANIKAPGGQVKKIRYGPFAIPAMGMLENKDIRNITKPCTDCFITAYEAGLEDEAGKSVNTDVGAWLHRKFFPQILPQSSNSSHTQTFSCTKLEMKKKI